MKYCRCSESAPFLPPPQALIWSVARVRRFCWSRPPTLVVLRSWAGVCRTVSRVVVGGGLQDGGPHSRARVWRTVVRTRGQGSAGRWSAPSASLASYPEGLPTGVRRTGRPVRLSLDLHPRGRVSIKLSLLLVRNSRGAGLGSVTSQSRHRC